LSYGGFMTLQAVTTTPTLFRCAIDVAGVGDWATWNSGAYTDLNTLIPTDSPLHLLFAESINDVGEITGQGCVMPACTEFHAFRATPKC
jgi:predicted peptidase